MSRKRNHSFIETGQLSDSQAALMDSTGSSVRAEESLCELELDEELVCSVSEITEHLGRNITVALEEALSEIRKVVSARTRLLKIELREKTDEIELLKARLECVSSEPARKSEFLHAPPKSNNTEPKKAKAAAPTVKKENIDAICDYLMKDKNSRGAADVEGERHHHHQHHHQQQQNQASLSPWTESEDIFSMLPSASKRLYDYEWMSGVELNSSSEYKEISYFDTFWRMALQTSMSVLTYAQREGKASRHAPPAHAHLAMDYSLLILHVLEKTGYKISIKLFNPLTKKPEVTMLRKNSLRQREEANSKGNLYTGGARTVPFEIITLLKLYSKIVLTVFVNFPLG